MVLCDLDLYCGLQLLYLHVRKKKESTYALLSVS